MKWHFVGAKKRLNYVLTTYEVTRYLFNAYTDETICSIIQILCSWHTHKKIRTFFPYGYIG